MSMWLHINYSLTLASIIETCICVWGCVCMNSDMTESWKIRNTLKFIYSKGQHYILYFNQMSETNMHSCVFVYVSESSECTLPKIKMIITLVNFYLSKKRRWKKSYVLSGEISFFLTACILYEYIWLLKLVQNWEKWGLNSEPRT